MKQITNYNLFDIVLCGFAILSDDRCCHQFGFVASIVLWSRFILVLFVVLFMRKLFRDLLFSFVCAIHSTIIFWSLELCIDTSIFVYGDQLNSTVTFLVKYKSPSNLIFHITWINYCMKISHIFKFNNTKHPNASTVLFSTQT